MRSGGRMTSSQKICHWGKYVVVAVVVVLLVLVCTDLTSIPSGSLISHEQPTAVDKHKTAADSVAYATASADSILHKLRPPDCTHISKLRDAIATTKASIWAEWEVSQYPQFLRMMHVPRRSWNIQKAKFIKLLLEQQLADREKGYFVVGFSGSSITAGHDNLFQDAYPAAFYRTMLPVMQAMGLELVVRNQAIGNNPCFPYDACVATHMGKDLDILTWEQTMNCGRNCHPLDTFTRAAYFIPKRPTVIYMLSGGPAWSLVDCIKLNLTDPLQTSQRPALTLDEQALLKQTARLSAENSKHMHEMSFLKDGEEMLFDRFASIGPMAQSTFPAEPYKCYGPYNYTFSEQSGGKQGAPWHPGKRAHQLRGQNLAYFLLSILEDSVDSVTDIICNAINNSTVPDENSRAVDKMIWKHMQSSFNTSDFIQDDFDLTRFVASEQPPRNHANLDPIWSSALVLKYVTDHLATIYRRPLPVVPAQYNLNETNHPATCYTDFEPREQNALTAQVLSTTWTRNLSFFDVNGVEKAIQRGLGYLDRKYVYMSSGPQTSIAVKVTVSHTSRLWLCELQKGFLKYPAHMADLPEGAEVSIQYNSKGVAYRQELELLADQCYRTNTEIRPGTHTVTVVQKADKQVNLAYVVAW